MILLYWRQIAGALGVVAILAAFGMTYRAGYNSAAAQCDTRALQAQLDAANRDLTAARNAARDAETKAAELDAKALESDEKVSDLEKELNGLAAAPTLPPNAAAEPRVIVRTVPGECPAPPAGGASPSGPYRASPDDINRLRR